MVKLAHKPNTTSAANKRKPKVVFSTSTTKAKKVAAEPAVKEMSKEQMEKEISRLKGMLADMRQSSEIVDPVTGLPKRTRYMELASAEFNRTRRYGHDLTLVVAKVTGHSRIQKKYGQEAADKVMTSIAEICTSSTRLGVDILGRISDDKVAMLLPETNLKGGQLCLDRIRKLVTSMPITIDGETVKIGMHVAARPLREEHTSFVELLVSA